MLSFVSLALLAGCKSPSINLATSEPIKVDIAMRLDVVQHGGEKPAKTATAPTAAEEIALRRRNRLGEVQVLKDSRLIGENRLGLLSVRNEPPGDYGKYVQRTVEAENKDRELEMQRIARERSLSIDAVRDEQSKLTRANAFTGEWVEVPQADGSYTWIKKSD